MAQARLTITNSMAGADFESALERHVTWRIHDLDLRDGIYGHWLTTLPLAEAERAAKEIRVRDLNVHCLSSYTFFGDLVELLELPGTGPLRSLFGTYPMSIPRNGARVLEHGGGPSKWMVDGCHPLALMLELGGPVDAVTTHRGTHGGGALILHFASGAIGNVHLAEGAPVFQPSERYVAYAEKSTVTIDNTTRVIYQRGIPFRYTSGTTFAPPGTDTGAWCGRRRTP